MVWEASAKVPAGLTEGSQYQLGNFDECLSIKEPFAAQYCLATIHIEIEVNRTVLDPFSLEYKPYMNLYEKLDYTNDPNKIPRNKLFWGLCLPASCDPRDIQEELQLHLDGERNSYIKQYHVQIQSSDCQNAQTGYGYTTADYTFYAVIGFFLITVGICTMYDCKYVHQINEVEITRRKSVKLMLCFSAKQNFHDLNKQEGSNKKFQIFYGFKVLLMSALLFGHSICNMLMGSIFNFDVIEQNNRSFSAMLICRGDLLLDIFFSLGGLLNTYSYLNNKHKFNPLRLIILRYFRLVPVFAIVTFFYSTIFYQMGSGPMWPKIIGREKLMCTSNWWTNILLIENYVHVDNMCVTQGWYLGADFQAFLLSFPLNYLIKKNNKLCWTIFSTIFFVSILIPFMIIYVGGQDPLFNIFNDFFFSLRTNENVQSMYIPVHTRMSTYILGMMMGFGYYKLRNSKLKFTFIPSLIALLVATTIMCLCLFGGIVFYNPYLPKNSLRSAFYASLHRPAFIIAGSTILFFISFGSIPNILPWKAFIPLGKLSFSVYLTHFIFQLSKVASQTTPISFTIYYWVSQALSELVLSFIMAFLLFIFIENPCNRFMKEILTKKKETQSITQK